MCIFVKLQTTLGGLLTSVEPLSSSVAGLGLPNLPSTATTNNPSSQSGKLVIHPFCMKYTIKLDYQSMYFLNLRTYLHLSNMRQTCICMCCLPSASNAAFLCLSYCILTISNFFCKDLPWRWGWGSMQLTLCNTIYDLNITDSVGTIKMCCKGLNLLYNDR